MRWGIIGCFLAFEWQDLTCILQKNYSGFGVENRLQGGKDSKGTAYEASATSEGEK